ncbi:O-antigen ligase family protein [Acinetobacter beijerinckii]|uniref:O-antigen ligase family protein n=1 Tax=Acinetobacter beijerinckii TaxID=262668 RepID=UPI0040551D09
MIKRIEYLVGFFIPLCIFIDPTSSILLSNSSLTESNTAVPISLLVVPFVIISILRSSFLDKKILFFGSILIFFFVSWSLALAIQSSFNYSYISFLYAFQWVYPTIWFFYFLTLNTSKKIHNFAQGFFLGSFVSSAYIFLAGILEIILYGGLQDQGRVSQNLILPGHYQMYVYMPTIVAYSTLIIVLMQNIKLINLDRIKYSAFLFFSTTSIIFLGAREAILVLVLGLICLYSTKSVKNFLRTFIFASFLGLITATFISLIKEWGESGKVRIITKIMNLGDDGKEFGGRDDMAEIYINIINQDVLFGTKMVPGQLVFPYLGEFAPSAHNYYIDAWAWTGFFGFLIIVISLVSMLMYSVIVFFKNKNYALFNLLFLLTLFVFVSLLINVPLRQPLTAPIIFIIFGLIVYFSKKEMV